MPLITSSRSQTKTLHPTVIVYSPVICGCVESLQLPDSTRGVVPFYFLSTYKILHCLGWLKVSVFQFPSRAKVHPVKLPHAI